VMMMKSVVLVLALLAVSTFGQSAFVFSNTNVTLTNGNQFTYRNLIFLEILNELSVASTSVTVNPTSATLDGLYGVAAAPFLNLTPKSPYAWVLFINAAAQWTGGTPTSNVTTAAVSASDAFVGKVFISLDEVDANGNVVQTIFLKDLQYLIVDNGPLTGNLRYATFEGKQSLLGAFSVKITFLASSTVGVLNVGPLSVMTPKSFESVVNITNFPYISTANSVRLNLGVITQAATAQFTAQYTHLAGGTGNSATYFSLNTQGLVGGAVSKVKISAFQTVNATATATWNIGDVTAMATAKYANAVSFNVVSVTFPAGATSIVYDPTIGAGAAPPQIGSASTVSISFALLVLLVLVL